MKKPIFRVISILLILILIVASNLADREVARLDRQKAAADKLLRDQQYDEAILAYGQLLQKTPVSRFGRDKTYLEQGMEGVLHSVDALLETLDGARYLADSGSIDTVLALATHPRVPASFREELESRATRGDEMLAAEAEKREAQRRQEQMNEALEARAQGRLEEALELAKASGLRPELIGEIEEEIIQKRNEGLAAEARAAIDALQFTEATVLAEQVHDEALRETLKAEIEAGIVREHDKGVAAEARAALDSLRIAEALALVEQMTDEAARASLRQEINDGWTEILAQLQEKYKNTLWAGAWYTLALGNDACLTGDKRYEGLAAGLSAKDTVIGGVFGWMILSDGKVTLVGDTLGAVKTAAQIADAADGAMGWNHGLILHRDGTVTNLGNWTYDRNAVADWADIHQVAAGGFHSLGLTRDGRVVAAGLDLDGQCQVAAWENVNAIAAGLRHSVALLRDGHVAAVGDNSFGQCDVDGWENIVDVRCGGNFTLGLTADGRLLAVGDNGCGQCDVDGWENVVAFDGGLWHTAALLQDGQVVCVGANGHSQCALQGTTLFETDSGNIPAFGPASAETEYVYTGDAVNGPWLYYNGEGAVIVSFDEATDRLKATRADLICTWGNPPVGILAGGGDKPKDPIRATKLAMQNRAVFALTGDYYTMHRNAKGILIRRGRVIREKTKTIGCAFFPDGSLRLVDPSAVTAEELLSQGIQDAWVFGPVLIADGELQNFKRHFLARNGEITMRTVLATYCPYHHLAACYGFTSLRQAADDLVGCGCEVAYNLDGGRSSMMVFMGEIVNKTAFVREGWRGLREMVGFLTSDLVPMPK